MKFSFVSAMLLALSVSKSSAQDMDLHAIEENHATYDKETLNAILEKLDFSTVAERMKYDMMEEIQKKEFIQKLQSDIALNSAKLIQEQIALGDKFKEFDQSIFANKDAFETGLLHKRLGAILNSLKNPDNMNEMFDHVDSEDMHDGTMTSFNMQFNTKTNEVRVSTEAVDKKGDPLYEFVMNPDTGIVKQIKRDRITSHEKVIEKELDTTKFITAKTTTSTATKSKPATRSFDSSKYQEEWDDLDAQRDLAFKIVYFFIAFITVTFGLLYVYFRMHQKELQEEQERKARGVKNYNIRNSDETFFDFLVGQMDYEKGPVNPKATVHSNQSDKNTTISSQRSGRFDHRDNAGFGSNNLDNLGE